MWSRSIESFDPNALLEDSNEQKPETAHMTRGEKIRAMTDEELAEWIYETPFGSPWCQDDAFPTDDNGECLSEDGCQGCIFDWLKSEAKETEESK